MGGRCICGRSATFPVCDGTHTEEDWTCSSRTGVVVVRGGRHLDSAAMRLAHHLGARTDTPDRAERLVLLVDAADLVDLRHHAAAVHADRVEVLAVDLPAAAVKAQLPHATVREVQPDTPLRLWHAVRAALDEAPAPAAPLPRAFVSHAVADEAVLLPVVDRLRRLAGARLFLCADSLAPGSRWLDGLLEELAAAERFVLVVSAASVGSTFCAFETGWARHAGLPIHAVSLDGTPPPAFVADLQMTDVVRYRAARPWLRDDEALTEVVLEALG